MAGGKEGIAILPPHLHRGSAEGAGGGSAAALRQRWHLTGAASRAPLACAGSRAVLVPTTESRSWSRCGLPAARTGSLLLIRTLGVGLLR